MRRIRVEDVHRLTGGNGSPPVRWSVERLRAYLAHVKATVQPTVSSGAQEVLVRYYQLQRSSDSRAAARTTIRLLESLVRIATAHARFLARSEAGVQDAVISVQLVEASMSSAGFTPAASALHSQFAIDADEEYRRAELLVLRRLGLDHLRTATAPAGSQPPPSLQLRGAARLPVFPIGSQLSARDVEDDASRRSGPDNSASLHPLQQQANGAHSSIAHANPHTNLVLAGIKTTDVAPRTATSESFVIPRLPGPLQLLQSHRELRRDGDGNDKRRLRDADSDSDATWESQELEANGGAKSSSVVNLQRAIASAARAEPALCEPPLHAHVWLGEPDRYAPPPGYVAVQDNRFQAVSRPFAVSRPRIDEPSADSIVLHQAHAKQDAVVSSSLHASPVSTPASALSAAAPLQRPRWSPESQPLMPPPPRRLPTVLVQKKPRGNDAGMPIVYELQPPPSLPPPSPSTLVPAIQADDVQLLSLPALPNLLHERVAQASRPRSDVVELSHISDRVVALQNSSPSPVEAVAILHPRRELPVVGAAGTQRLLDPDVDDLEVEDV